MFAPATLVAAGAAHCDDLLVMLPAVLRKSGDSLLYLYDARAGWQHVITLERWLSTGEDGVAAARHDVVPSCLVGEKACPPEECEGGPEGYRHFLEAVRVEPAPAEGEGPEGAAREARRQQKLAWATERVGRSSVALSRSGAIQGLEGAAEEWVYSWDEEAFSPHKATQAMRKALQSMQATPADGEDQSSEEGGEGSAEEDGSQVDSADFSDDAEGQPEPLLDAMSTSDIIEEQLDENSDEGIISGLDESDEELGYV